MIQTVKKHENSTIQENKQKRLAKFYKNSKNKPNNVDGPTNHVVTRVYGETSPMPIKPKIIVPVVNVDVVEKTKPDNTNISNNKIHTKNSFKHKQVVIIITLHVLNSIFYNFHLFINVLTSYLRSDYLFFLVSDEFHSLVKLSNI